jgi:hypothetical protein
VRRVGFKTRAGLAALLAAAVIAGCSTAKKQQPIPAAADPNAFPANYRAQVARYLAQNLKDPADFHGALIAQPALKKVGDTQHYVVCIQLNGRNRRKDKVAIYLSAEINQYVDSTPEQCGDAAYQPLKELENEKPNQDQESFPTIK